MAGSDKTAAASRVALAVCERHGDITRRVAGTKPHQHAALLVATRSFKRVADVTGFRHALSGNLEDHVALLDAAIGGRAIRFDLRDDDTVLAVVPCRQVPA